jgi:hypothetical protein
MEVFKMLDQLDNIWNSCTNWLEHISNQAIGNGLIIIGSHMEEVAGVLIMVGILFWMLKNTKVFRYGCITYALGLLIELIGSVMVK